MWLQFRSKEKIYLPFIVLLPSNFSLFVALEHKIPPTLLVPKKRGLGKKTHFVMEIWKKKEESNPKTPSYFIFQQQIFFIIYIEFYQLPSFHIPLRGRAFLRSEDFYLSAEWQSVFIGSEVKRTLSVKCKFKRIQLVKFNQKSYMKKFLLAF